MIIVVCQIGVVGIKGWGVSHGKDFGGFGMKEWGDDFFGIIVLGEFCDGVLEKGLNFVVNG